MNDPRLNIKNLVVIGLIALAMAVSFGLPKPKYVSTNILPALNIPMDFAGWKARDISNEVSHQGEAYNFISNVFARIYRNAQGQDVLLLILDAGNFHNPKVCYGSSGFINTDMPDTTFAIPGRPFKATTLFLEKDKTGLVVTYWLCINKKLVTWTEQKVQELFSTLLNKKKTGLMVRIDVPTSRPDKTRAVAIAQDFVQTLSAQLTPQEKDYLFGK